MRLARTHRRLAVFMSLASLLAFAGGAGVQPLAATLASIGLAVAFFWQPHPELSARLEKLWLPIALLLVVRALFHVLVIRDDVVIPVVDLLFLLLAAECLRSLDARNDGRIYSLSFALLLASTAYRPGLLFLVAFVAYVGLATATLMVGNFRRECDRHGARVARAPRTFLFSSAALSTVILAVATVVFLAFPRVSRGWSGRGEALASSIAGFADEVALGSHGSRIYGNPRIVLRVEFPRGAPSDFRNLYWRGRSYDHFDGIRWSRSRRLPPAQAPPSWYERWGSDVLVQRIYGAPLQSRVLFAVHPLMDVESESGMQPITSNSGDHLYWGIGPPGYTAYSLRGRPGPSELRSAEGGFVPARSFYTQLPPLPGEILDLADSLLAHLPTDYDRAVALERWFREEFTYTLELPRTARDATLERFLLSRRAGHCEYFSTSMAILLRTQGIPTREVNGFLGGNWSRFGDYLAVTQNEAHAWVEVWFPAYGWVPFDPTPPGRGESLGHAVWFWPGRFFLDAVQHRWNKWVLDYSFQTQFVLMQRGQEAVTEAAGLEPGATGDPFEWLGSAIVPWALGGLLLILLTVRLRQMGRKVSQETRMFLRLRGSARKAGVPMEALHSPGALTEYLEAAEHPAANSARRFVEGYLRGRFSGLLLREEDARDTALALQEARRRLRGKRAPGARP